MAAHQRRRLRSSAIPSIFSFVKKKETSERTKRYETQYLELSAHVVPSTSQESVLLAKERERLDACRRDLRNTRRREKRLRLTLESVISDLKDAKLVNQELEEKLHYFKGIGNIHVFR